jgi:hypothetical protein
MFASVFRSSRLFGFGFLLPDRLGTTFGFVGFITPHSSSVCIIIQFVFAACLFFISNLSIVRIYISVSASTLIGLCILTLTGKRMCNIRFYADSSIVNLHLQMEVA